MTLKPPMSVSATLMFENFSQSNSTNKEITFSFPSFPNYQFIFGLVTKNSNFPATSESDFKNDHFVYLLFDNIPQDELSVEYIVSITTANGEKLFSKYYEWDYSKSRKTGHHVAKFISHDELTDAANKFVINNKLTLLCELKVVETKKSTNLKPEQVLPNNQLCEDFESLLESAKFSDAALIVGEQELLVHKNILSARSKVFASMFEHDCKEKRQNRVEITDISVEVCKQMLRYIYIGKVPEMNECAAEIFVAADKYQLDHLKIACEQHLSTSIDNETAANTLLVADMHSATLLKTKCMDYVIEHSKEVVATDGWKQLAKTRPDLAVQLFETIANKK